MSQFKDNDYYVVAKEPGAENPALPTWANRQENPAQLAQVHNSKVSRVDVPGVPGTFQLFNVLSREECQHFIDITENLGYLEDAPVSLTRKVRHNDNVTWVVDETTDALLWQRSREALAGIEGLYEGKSPVGINARFRFYRYQQDDFFKVHTDGAWPGSRVVDESLIHNAYADRYSQMTYLILLSDDFEGGSTQFWVDKENPALPARNERNAVKVNIRTPAGSVLCFPHGYHPMHCLHSSEVVTKGIKYIVRTDLLFEL